MLLESVLKRDRALVAISIAGATVMAWGYILAGAGMGMPALRMSGLPTAAGVMPFMAPAVWTEGYAALMLSMWWLMMAGMMLPSAAPTILLFAALSRERRKRGSDAASAAAFCGGYLSIWGMFGIAAVALQWALDRVALLSPEMATSSVAVGAAILIGAGLWQFTPAKNACLRKCRSPIQFLTQHWRPGARGAWRMGVRHGIYCLGCCWVLMLLLFYGGVMNVYWIAGLAVFVLVEKTVSAGRWLGWLSGAVLIGWGAVLMLALI